MALASIFETTRLILRPPMIEDAEAMFENWCNDPEVTRYMVWAPHRSVDDTKEFIRMALEGELPGAEQVWLITLKEDRTPIGTIGARIADFKANLGFALSRRFWGQGIMTEAAKQIVDSLWQDPEIFRIQAVCDPQNFGSASVLQKIGLELEGTLKAYIRLPAFPERPCDCLSFAAARP